MSFSNYNLSSEQLEELLLRAENEARKYILSQIPQKEINNLEILIEFDTSNELKLNCIIDLQLVKQSKLDPKKFTDVAINKIFEIIENELEIIA
ncbi:MAG: DUF3194 domain-containing protein [Promethearchaeota archaeon]